MNSYLQMHVQYSTFKTSIDDYLTNYDLLNVETNSWIVVLFDKDCMKWTNKACTYINVTCQGAQSCSHDRV